MVTGQIRSHPPAVPIHLLTFCQKLGRTGISVAILSRIYSSKRLDAKFGPKAVAPKREDVVSAETEVSNLVVSSPWLLVPRIACPLSPHHHTDIIVLFSQLAIAVS